MGEPFTSRDYWRTARPEAGQGLVPPRSNLAFFFKRWFPRRPGLSAIEIGALPGSHLVYLAKRFGYACTALDFCLEVEALGRSFEAVGACDYRLVHADFMTWEPDRQYDIVFSIGFVEHFANYREAIEKHWRLTRPGGLLLVGVPTLSPFQLWARKTLYPPEKLRSVFATHLLEIMSRGALRGELERLPDAQMVFCDHVMKCDVWFGRGDVRPSRWWLYYLVRAFAAGMRRVAPSSKLYSPMVLGLARKAVSP